MRGAELFVRCLENEGIEYIFGMPGEENIDFDRASIFNSVQSPIRGVSEEPKASEGLPPPTGEYPGAAREAQPEEVTRASPTMTVSRSTRAKSGDHDLTYSRFARAAFHLTVIASLLDPAWARAREAEPVADAYDQVARSVVLIRVDGVYFDPMRRDVVSAAGSGSGFAIKPGLVVTNYHVVAEATRIEVFLSDGLAAEAEVVGTAPGYDLALLRVPFSRKQLPPAELNETRELRVGQTVLALGHPLGGDHSLTVGVVSGLNRDLRASELGASWVQFDAPINPGQSGGPLVNLEGRVVGITTAKIQGAEALGFAVPSELVAATLSDLEGMGHPYRPSLGMTGVAVNPSLARLFALPVQWGVMIADVEVASVAEGAGLEAGHRRIFLSGQEYILGGDIIVGIDGRLIQGPSDLTRALLNGRPGQKLELSVVGGGGPRKLVLELPEMRH